VSRAWDEAEHPRDEDGRFTEAWAASLAATLPHRFMTHAQLADYADRTDYTRAYFHGGGSSITAVRTYSDGRELLEKYHIDTDDQADTEVAVSYIGGVVRAPVPPVVLLPETDEDGNLGTLSEYIHGKTAAQVLPEYTSIGIPEYERRTGELAAQYQDDRLGLLDLLIGNTDRHAGNWIIAPTDPHHRVQTGPSRVVGIDHANAEFQGHTTSPFADYLYDTAAFQLRTGTHSWPTAELDRIQRGIDDLHHVGIVPAWEHRSMSATLRDLRKLAPDAPGRVQ